MDSAVIALLVVGISILTTVSIGALIVLSTRRSA